MLEVTDRKFFSQIANGEAFSSNLSDYTQNLVGSVMERVVVETTIELSIISQATASNEFTIDATAKTITRASGDWTDDGWYTGEHFRSTNGDDFDAIITDLNGDVLTYDESGSTTGSSTSGSYSGLTVYILDDDYKDAVIRFGLPENSDTSENFTNVVDGSDQGFTLKGITGTYQTMTPFAGAKSWITGDCKIKKTGFANGVATYVIWHEFIILPYYLQEIEANLTDGTLPEDYFKGNLSLKYILNVQLRKLLTDPNIQQEFSDTSQQGYVGWFGENYNGGVNNYEVEVTGYLDGATSVDGVQIDKVTTVTARLTNTAGLFNVNTIVGAYVSAILSPLDYAANNTLYKTLWLYDNVLKTNNTTHTGLTGIIKTFESTRVDADTIDIEMSLEFSASQQARLSEGQEFIIAFQTADSTLARNVSDSVIMIGEVSELEVNNDIPGLCEFTDFRHYNHPALESDAGNTNFNGWIEDGIFSKLNFGLDIEEEARLEQLTFKLIAKKSTGREFTIQQHEFDLSSGVLVPEGVYEKQVFNLDTTRGFYLQTGDYFNRVRLGFPTAVVTYFYGEELATNPTTEFDFNGALANTNYATIYLGQYQSGVTGGPTKSVTGFTVPTDTAGNTLPWIAALLGTSIPGITVGTATLPAGQTNYAITHAAIAGAHTIIPCDVNLAGMVFSTINTSKTSTGFEVADTGSGGRLDYIIVEDGVLSSFRSGSGEALPMGGGTISFSNLGTNNYTALVFSVNYVGKLYAITKNNASIDVANDDADEVNYILIVN